MESAIVGTKGQLVIPRKIRARFHIRQGTRVHPPSPVAPPLGGEEGEARVASERFRPTGTQEGATDLPVGLHFEARNGEITLTPITPRYFEYMAGCLGTGGKALRLLLEEKKKRK